MFTTKLLHNTNNNMYKFIRWIGISIILFLVIFISIYLSSMSSNKHTSTSDGVNKTQSHDTHTPTSDAVNITDFNTQMLNFTNQFRKKYNSQPLKNATDLQNQAQAYANYLAKSNTFQHGYVGSLACTSSNSNTNTNECNFPESDLNGVCMNNTCIFTGHPRQISIDTIPESKYTNKPFGQNLFMINRGGTPGKSQINNHDLAKTTIASWGAECSNCSSDICIPSENTGHFTQQIWKSTTEMGCARAFSNGTDYIVCNYSPPGNNMSQNIVQSNLPYNIQDICNNDSE